MTHQQMLRMGFKLLEFPIHNQQYSFQNIYFVPKRSIWRITRAQLMLGMFSAGYKQGYITGKNLKS